MQRRKLLKTAGASLTAATVGGGALLATAGGASASGDFGLSAPVTVSSDDGTVEYVAIYGDSVVSWEGFEEPAQQFAISIDLTVKDGDGNVVHGPAEIHSTGLVDLGNADWGGVNESLSGPGTSGSIESAIGLDADGNHDPTVDWHIVGTDPDGYALPGSPVAASHLESGTDGETLSFTLEMASTYTWYDSAAADTSAEPLHSETFTSVIPVEVENVPTSASTSDGSGSDGATAA